MNDSPGWASPGSAPSDEPDRGTQEQSAQQTAPEEPAAERPSPPNWSKQQPPAGHWSSPTGIPGQGGPADENTEAGTRARAGTTIPGQGGWNGPAGGGPGWSTGWAPTPPAAKPGVIPLRPLGVGEILDGAVSTMRAHWRTVLGISLMIAVVSQTLITVVTRLWLKSPGRPTAIGQGTRSAMAEAMHAMLQTLVANAATALIGLLATLFATGLLTMVTSRAVLGRSVTTAQAWQDARGRLPHLLGLLLLLPVILMAIAAIGLAPGILLLSTSTQEIGLLFIVFGGLAVSIVSVWLAVRYSLASPALMLEKQGVIASMRRSAKLVRGSWWRVLGIQLLAYLLVALVEFIIQIPTTLIAFVVGGENLMDWANGTNSTTSWSFLAVMGIGAVISSALTFPISAGVTALLYMDQRIRREALDLELARAAGLPGYGTDTAGTAAPGAPADAPTDTTPGS
ncbi:hypothetical protein [Streptomyces sp. NPDC053427]|uniref:hypothetical protein n=1 Tax=Streptomyces sp. NPDC053427 TaxID=3365701 RepID=UPI0037CD52CF